MADPCNFPAVLSACHLRATPLRLRVLEILASENRPWPAREILAAVQKARPAHKVSIYRILEELQRRGLVRRVVLKGGVTYFELACEHHPPHPHFHCWNCGALQCLEPVPLERLWLELKGPLGNRVDQLEIKATGLCRRCREKTEKATG